MKIRTFRRTAFSGHHKPWMVLCALVLLVFFVAASAAATPKAKKLEDWSSKDWKKFGAKLAGNPKVKKMSSLDRAKYISEQVAKKYDAAGIKPNYWYFGKGRSGLTKAKPSGSCGDLTVNLGAALDGAGFRTGSIEVSKTSINPFNVNRNHGAPIVVIDGEEYVFDLWYHSGAKKKFSGFKKSPFIMKKIDWKAQMRDEGYTSFTYISPPPPPPGVRTPMKKSLWMKKVENFKKNGATTKEAIAAANGSHKDVLALMKKLKARKAKAEKKAKEKADKEYKKQKKKDEEAWKKLEKEKAIARLKEKIRLSKSDAEPENSRSQAGMTPKEWHEKLKKNDPEAWKKMGDALKSGDPDKIDAVIKALGAKSTGGEGGGDPLRDAEEESGGAAAAGDTYMPPTSPDGNPLENPNSWVPSGREATAAERGESAQAANADRMGRIAAQGQSVDENIANAANQHGSAESAVQGQRQRSSAVADAVVGGLTSGVAAGVDAAGGTIGAGAGNVVGAAAGFKTTGQSNHQHDSRSAASSGSSRGSTGGSAPAGDGQNHSSAGASPFQGTLTGGWGGKDTDGEKYVGSFFMRISPGGRVTGSFSGDGSGSLSGSVSNTGNVNVHSGGGSVSGGGSWQGTIGRSSTGALWGRGSWSVEGASGGWSGGG